MPSVSCSSRVNTSVVKLAPLHLTFGPARSVGVLAAAGVVSVLRPIADELD